MSPTIFKVKGYRFYFLSYEENRIHIHVTCEDGEAKFWIEPIVSLAISHGLNPRKLNGIQKIVEEHKNEIASSIMKCNTWESRRENAILSVYGKELQALDIGRARQNDGDVV